VQNANVFLNILQRMAQITRMAKIVNVISPSEIFSK